MIDLETSYLGLALRNPLVASAGPLSESIGNIRRLEDAGAGAVVLYSLFEEQITLESYHLDHHLSHGTESFAESLTYLPDVHDYKLGPDAYLEHIRRAKAAVGIPVIGSLNGVSTGGWISYAKKIQEAGADALELNVYFIPTDPAVKLGHFWSAFANVASRLDGAGARGLVLFNRFYQPDFDLENLEVVPTLTLSSSYELLLRLHWTAILYGRVQADLAVTGGVHTVEDVLKAMMAGARVAMMTSALLRHGIEHLSAVRDGLRAWMEAREYASIRQMQGSMSYRSVHDPSAFERANYMRVLSSYTLRTGRGAGVAEGRGWEK
jgi:dihydroorotate dehydrogenase (fumarate)